MNNIIKKLDDINEDLENTKNKLYENSDKIISYISIGIFVMFIYGFSKEIYNEVQKIKSKKQNGHKKIN